jgi:hypothetical protein
VLGFHGCDRTVAEAVVGGSTGLTPSQNSYDWLGDGIYFWENNPQRALEFATEFMDRGRKGKPRIKTPAVIGAVIDLGFCLNLLDAKFLQILRGGFEVLQQTLAATGEPRPVNKSFKHGGEILMRDLDCAVINSVHRFRADQKLPEFDTVRSAFVEGGELFAGSTFREKNHIQISVRNPRCIKGYFWPVGDLDAGPDPK